MRAAEEWVSQFKLEGDERKYALLRVATEVFTGVVDGDLKPLAALLFQRKYEMAAAELLQYSCKDGKVVALQRRVADQRLFWQCN